MSLFTPSTTNRASVGFSSFYGVSTVCMMSVLFLLFWIFPRSSLLLKLCVRNRELWRFIQSELWVVSALTPKLSSEYAKKCLRWLTSSNSLAGKSSILVGTLLFELSFLDFPKIRSQMITLVICSGGKQGGPGKEPSVTDERRLRPRHRVRCKVHRDVAGDGTPH